MSEQQGHRSTTTTTSYKTEMQVPVRRDDQTFEERQKNMWGEMNERMERRRREWAEEVDHLRSEFFRLRPDETTARRGSGENLLEKMDLNSMFYDTGKGTKLFRVSFDVSQFEPHEISVRAHNQNLIVHAKHEEKGSEKNVSREFSRQVVIPSNVNPETLRSTLSNDGILQVEADLPAPAYDQLPTDRTPRLSSLVQGPPGPRDPIIHPGGGQGGSEGSQLFQLTVDIGSDFLPQDLTVKTVDRKLVVQARHEEKAPGRTSCRQFNREFEIPEGVDPNLVTASLAPGGKLVLEAPLVRPPQAGPMTTGGSVAGGQQKQSVINVSCGGK